MPYKEQVHPKLPRKPGKSKELTALGEAYGETTPCVQSFSFELTSCSLVSGELIYQWMKSMSTNCETKIEYDFLFAELQAFLDRKQTSVDLGNDCINAMRSLLLNLRTKENKLAGYH